MTASVFFESLTDHFRDLGWRDDADVAMRMRMQHNGLVAGFTMLGVELGVVVSTVERSVLFRLSMFRLSTLSRSPERSAWKSAGVSGQAYLETHDRSPYVVKKIEALIDSFMPALDLAAEVAAAAGPASAHEAVVTNYAGTKPLRISCYPARIDITYRRGMTVDDVRREHPELFVAGAVAISERLGESVLRQVIESTGSGGAVNSLAAALEDELGAETEIVGHIIQGSDEQTVHADFTSAAGASVHVMACLNEVNELVATVTSTAIRRVGKAPWEKAEDVVEFSLTCRPASSPRRIVAASAWADELLSVLWEGTPPGAAVRWAMDCQELRLIARNFRASFRIGDSEISSFGRSKMVHARDELVRKYEREARVPVRESFHWKIDSVASALEDDGWECTPALNVSGVGLRGEEEGR